MILTGKAKQDFEKGIIEILKQKYNEKIDDNKIAIDWIYNSNDLILLAHIIEWLDSVGIYINIRCFEDRCISFITGDSSQFFEINREEAYKQAIIKANEIYNNLNK